LERINENQKRQPRSDCMILEDFHCHFTKLTLPRVDPMAKKDWYDVKVPNIFDKNDIGKTFVNQTAGKGT
jgi:hypothetical protein